MLFLTQTGPKPGRIRYLLRNLLVQLDLDKVSEGLQNLYSPVRLRSAPPTNSGSYCSLAVPNNTPFPLRLICSKRSSLPPLTITYTNFWTL